MTEDYPHKAEPGGVIAIGPECFASSDRSVICWQGVNFYREPDDDELARVFVAMDGIATEVPVEVHDDGRCPSCEHRAEFHQPEGCWFAITNAQPGTTVGCNCIGWTS